MNSRAIRKLIWSLMTHEVWEIRRMLEIGAASLDAPRLTAVLIACGFSCLLVGCGPEPQVIEPGYESLPKCDVQIEIPVEELDQAILHDCNAEGVRIQLPEEWGVVEVGPVGTTSSRSSDKLGEVTNINWGIEGVGVTFRDGDDRHIWGSTEAARRKQAAGTR